MITTTLWQVFSSGWVDLTKAPRLRRYLDSGFPLPHYIGGSRRLARIDAGKLDQWLARR